MQVNIVPKRCSAHIKKDQIEFIEATDNDKPFLETCIKDLQYIIEYTGWEESSEDEAKDLLDHVDLPKNGKKENDRLYIIKKEGLCLGYCKFYEGAMNDPFKIFLGYMGILKEYQKKGMGKEAYTVLEEEIKNNGYTVIRLNVGTRNIEALSFWIRNGYREIVSLIKYKNGYMDINLEKRLT
ncbi:MAG TPA: GNAT family N-acetyltransferase [Rectinemataceae bacterium]